MYAQPMSVFFWLPQSMRSSHKYFMGWVADSFFVFNPNFNCTKTLPATLQLEISTWIFHKTLQSSFNFFFFFLPCLHFLNFPFLITIFLCSSTLWDLTVSLLLSASFATLVPISTLEKKIKVLSVNRFTLTHTCCYSQVSSICACQWSFMWEP